MSVPEIRLRLSYSADRVDARQVWQTALNVLGRYRLLDQAEPHDAGRPWCLDLRWPDVGDYDWCAVRLWLEDRTELEFQWNGRLIEEVTETFCDDVACLAKEIMVASDAEFALAGWEGWFTGEDRPNAWEALRNSPELRTVPETRGGWLKWFYLLGPERSLASQPYLPQLGAQRIDPLPGGSIFLFFSYPGDFDGARRSWKLDMEFDPAYNPVARRNLEHPYQRRVHSALPDCRMT